jgi:hypothetical protein
MMPVPTQEFRFDGVGCYVPHGIVKFERHSGARKARTSDVQLHIGESRDSPVRNCAPEVWSFGPPGMTTTQKNAPVPRGVFAFSQYLPTL